MPQGLVSLYASAAYPFISILCFSHYTFVIEHSSSGLCAFGGVSCPPNRPERNPAFEIGRFIRLATVCAGP